jgi:uncharacterized protein (TIGR00255 family)
MPIRSMTGYAQVKGQATDQLGFSLSLKSVNHRFLDLHLRLPSDLESLEMKLRRRLKEKLARGHVELTLSLDRSGGNGLAFNREMVAAYVDAFRGAASEFGLSAEPDLNALLRMPGAMSASSGAELGAGFEAAVLRSLDEAIAALNGMRAEEGRGIERELRDRMQRMRQAGSEVEHMRTAVVRACMEKVQSRMKELLGAQADPERILQEAALLAERSDIQEEIVRLDTHIGHFMGLLEGDAEAGKKLDFLLQEMNREANTLLSKTTGLAGDMLRITQLGLALKAEIEKAREQVQNIE